MTRRIEGLIGVRGGKGCDCKDIAQKMDLWGITGCEKHRTSIINAILANREKLEVSLRTAAVEFTKSEGIVEAASLGLKLVGDWWHHKDVQTEAFTRGAHWLLDKSIEDVRNGVVTTSGIVRKPPAQQPAQSGPTRRRRRGFFRSDGNYPRFITTQQFQHDIKTLVGLIPPDITAIAGVARSGLSAATMISMYLHLPMITIRQTMNDIVPTGNGWRLGGSRHVDPKGKILVVDDTVMTGNSLKAIRPLVQSQLGNAVYATVYCNPHAAHKPDIFAVSLGWPHMLEWNIFNSILSPSVAMDFDGILCQDCPAGSDDDGERYLDFIQNARPLYVPRRCPVPLIVTARIEKYRKPTEEWLRRHGISWHKLVMHPAKTLRERQKDNIPAYKAKHYSDWALKHRPTPGPIVFMESEDWQAQRIAQISGRMAVCPSTAGVYLK
jgi:adenine/guanine phosphoribosyltransferase-like PRPP-binding protein